MGLIKPSSARLSVESQPQALVFINGQEAGMTPFEKDFKADQVTVKIVPQSTVPLTPYEVKLNLAAGVKTVVRRNIGESPESSSGEISSFEREAGNESSISIVSTKHNKFSYGS